MKKVVYSIKKVRGNSDDKISGLGFLNEEGTLLCRCVSKTGKPYTRAFDEVEQHCHPIIGKENEFKGYVTMYYEYEGNDIEVEYSVWYKTVTPLKYGNAWVINMDELLLFVNGKKEK